MVAGPLFGRLVHYAIAGTAGTVIVRAATALRPRVAPAARRATVSGVAVGIVAGRRLGEVAEEARLQAGDILAEAHGRLGEPAPPPVPADVPAGHEH